MSIRPLNNKVVVERIASEKSTSSGIILKHTDGPDRAKVLAIGPDVTEVSIGETVLINWNAATKSEGETFVISIDEIVFIYED